MDTQSFLKIFIPIVVTIVAIAPMGAPVIPATIPIGASISSATLSINVTSVIGSPHRVNIYRVTEPWTESGVTWNSFHGDGDNSYDPNPVTYFDVTTPGLYTINLTGLVQGWYSGLYPNYGIFIDEQPPAADVAFNSYVSYTSSEGEMVPNPYPPQLEICYNQGGPDTCVIVDRPSEPLVADAYLNQALPDTNFFFNGLLYTGRFNGYEKQSLLKFPFLIEQPVVASLGNFVWLDENRNGIQDEDPLTSAIAGVTVHLYTCAGDLVGTTQTDTGGFYYFLDLQPGSYYVEFIEPSGYHRFTQQDQGANDEMDSDVDVVLGRTVCTDLVAGENDLSWDAGLYVVRGGQGCTPGYWKQEQHFASWVAAGYSPDQLFSSVFENAFPGKTLLQVMEQGGGGLNALGRHTVAALLNASNGGVSYDLEASQVIASFNAVYPGAKAQYESVKDQFAIFNEQGCPLN